MKKLITIPTVTLLLSTSVFAVPENPEQSKPRVTHNSPSQSIENPPKKSWFSRRTYISDDALFTVGAFALLGIEFIPNLLCSRSTTSSCDTRQTYSESCDTRQTYSECIRVTRKFLKGLGALAFAEVGRSICMYGVDKDESMSLKEGGVTYIFTDNSKSGVDASKVKK